MGWFLTKYFENFQTVEAGKENEKCQMFMTENGDWSWNSHEIIIKSNTELLECPWCNVTWMKYLHVYGWHWGGDEILKLV